MKLGTEESNKAECVKQLLCKSLIESESNIPNNCNRRYCDVVTMESVIDEKSCQIPSLSKAFIHLETKM